MILVTPKRSSSGIKNPLYPPSGSRSWIQASAPAARPPNSQSPLPKAKKLLPHKPLKALKSSKAQKLKSSKAQKLKSPQSPQKPSKAFKRHPKGTRKLKKHSKNTQKTLPLTTHPAVLLKIIARKLHKSEVMLHKHYVGIMSIKITQTKNIFTFLFS
ncbi:hypothetical protein [Paenibacillus sp. PK3_47]|uniref:hypothetical protein n=1 Tax=Paenibacillus sp. PK3_47 TaxID=2072642 RepID=UPI00201E34B6|nr:hypothetical protein [Paenibacillus sp. PK3_47]